MKEYYDSKIYFNKDFKKNRESSTTGVAAKKKQDYRAFKDTYPEKKTSFKKIKYVYK